MPRPDMPSLFGRSPSSLSLSPSFLPLLSLALSHSCHAARTSNNSTAARRGKATSRTSSPTFSFSRILLSSSSERCFFLLKAYVLFLFSLFLSHSQAYVLVRKLHRAGCLPFILPSVILPSPPTGTRDTATLSASATASSTPTTAMPTGASRSIESPRSTVN